MEMDENSVGLILAIHEQTQKKTKKQKKQNKLTHIFKDTNECNEVIRFISVIPQ